MDLKWSILSKYRNEIYGFSALWIIVFHLVIIKRASFSKEIAFLSDYFLHGNCGVEIFFFLSGISLFYAIKKSKSLCDFYVRRFKRILIPLFIIDGVYWLCLCLVGDISVLQFLKNITFYSFWLEGNSLVWFVACLIVLYIFYPLIYKYILNNQSLTIQGKLMCIIMMCVCSYIFCWLFKSFDAVWYRNIEKALTRIPVFLLGCYCGILCYEEKSLSTLVKFGSLIITLIGIAYFFEHPVSLYKSYRIPYLLVGPSIAIWLAICLDTIQSKLLNRMMCLWGGTFTGAVFVPCDSHNFV
ncbi:MAG: acyltransferase [Phascolarctobacterium sp.]|uniref:acyltransferase family protein n=1 Tax=Phascolarctobacterium sp. TaxID=2049039 RepID=UPI0026DAD126|nr:acyltransferase [Phascolarctobacterium sp.]MDO4920370.1 acyltransferase [Phascolarctobacterium sp.]